MPLIPVTTQLPPDKIEPLKQAIARREKKLDRLKFGDVELALWTMDELLHLRELLKNQTATMEPEPS